MQEHLPALKTKPRLTIGWRAALRRWRSSHAMVSAGFMLVLILTLAMTVLGLAYMTSIHGRLQQAAQRWQMEIDVVLSMRNVVRERSLTMHRMYFTGDSFEREDEFERFTALSTEFLGLRSQLERFGVSARSRASYEAILALIRRSQPLQVELVDNIRRGRPPQDAAAFFAADVPLEKQILTRFDELVEHKREDARAALASEEANYRQTMLLVLMLGVASLGLGATVAYTVIRQTRRIEDQLSSEKEEAQVTLHAVADAVVATDAQGRVRYLNPVAEALTGWRSAEAQGRELAQVYSLINQATREPIEHPAVVGTVDGWVMGMDRQALLVSKSGEEFAVEDSAAPIHDASGATTGTVLVFRDVTATRSMARELSWQARHDPLTGLINRREFEARLARVLAAGADDERTHVLMYMDLDQFKIVNDSAGHAAGDELLRQVAALWQPLLRESDSLARLGGDEFGALLEGCPLEHAERIAHKMCDATRALRFTAQGRTFRIGVSIGIVHVHVGTGTVSETLSAADAACYLAKERGRDRVYVQHEGDRELVTHRDEMQWVTRIVRAIDEGRLQLYYQRVAPVRAVEGVHYYELLLRMVGEDGQLIPPMTFVPAAERYGLMSRIDRWVITRAFEWLHADAGGATVAINLSNQSLSDDQFLGFVTEQLKSAAVDPRRLCFEITETAAIASFQRATRFMAELSALGCRFALDDFGRGMSSFAYLKTLPVDFIKIDGGFVRQMVHDRVDAAMVEAIHRLGQVLGIETIAESVEDESVLHALRGLGVNHAQGFSIHRPEPLEGLAQGSGATEVGAA